MNMHSAPFALAAALLLLCSGTAFNPARGRRRPRTRAADGPVRRQRDLGLVIMAAAGGEKKKMSKKAAAIEEKKRAKGECAREKARTHTRVRTRSLDRTHRTPRL